MPYKNIEQRRKYAREYRAKNRKDFFEDKFCVNCNSRDRMELDHIDPSLKISHKIWTWSKERRDKEIEKCQVLCCKCHKKKTYIDVGYKEPNHGTIGRYKSRRYLCKCILCKAANAKYIRENRKNKLNHLHAGT